MAIENNFRIIQQRDTKANIEAITGTLEESLVAFATDVGEYGIYTNGEWKWFISVSAILTDDNNDILFDDDGNILTGGI